MDELFDVLIELTTDPFALEASAVNPAAMLAVAAAHHLGAEASSAVANGPWSACELCSDPGSDPPPRRVRVPAPSSGT